MIQELLLGGGLLVEDGKTLSAGTNTGPILISCSSTSSPATSSAAAASPTASTGATVNSEQQNLRCPRCDSTNTKFCYYNNYNLTQPRHFCKTCRRYWTKGGALRNVPIGGGCRKAKPATGAVGKGAGGNGPGGAKAKNILAASDLLVGKSAAGLGGLGLCGAGAAAGFDHELAPSSPILWASPPPNSHLLSLLRGATQMSSTDDAAANSRTTTTTTTSCRTRIANPNPTSPSILEHVPNPPIMRIKEEEGAPTLLLGSHLVPEASLLRNAFNARNSTAAVDPFLHVPLGLSSSSLWSGSQLYEYQRQQQRQQHGSGLLPADQAPVSSAIQEFYLQRLVRPSSGINPYADQYQAAMFLSNVGSSCSSSATAAPPPPPPSSSCSVSVSNVDASSTAASATPAAAAAAAGCPVAGAASQLIHQEPAAAAGGELGYYWSSPLAWGDLPATSNGAFP